MQTNENAELEFDQYNFDLYLFTWQASRKFNSVSLSPIKETICVHTSGGNRSIISEFDTSPSFDFANFRFMYPLIFCGFLATSVADEGADAPLFPPLFTFPPPFCCCFLLSSFLSRLFIARGISSPPLPSSPTPSSSSPRFPPFLLVALAFPFSLALLFISLKPSATAFALVEVLTMKLFCLPGYP